MNPEMMNNMMNNIDPQMMQNMMKNIDPQMMQNMMQNINPEMLSGLMGNLSQSTQNNSENNIQDEEPRFKNGQKILISNLKNENFNNKEGIIKYFDNDKQRYVIMIEDYESPISIKEDNCSEIIEQID